MYPTAKALIEAVETSQKTMGRLVLEEEMRRFGTSEKEIVDGLREVLMVMEESTNSTLEEAGKPSIGGIDGNAKRMMALEDSLCGRPLVETMAWAFSTFESNAAMGKIVAAPTAGSSGIMPATVRAAKEHLHASEDQLLEGLLVATGIGQMIGMYATFAGAEGGCQAECGSAASMAAGMLASVRGADVATILEAASLALVNVLGLVCDPIGGFVEYPCAYRNASGAVNAMLSADLAMAGCKSIVPFDEVCQAMGEVGRAMNENLRETGTGGLAATATGSRLRTMFLQKGMACSHKRDQI